ncbi:hypothetical protein C882_1627 [Caenispirillum salinarum AK4]|uniref:Xaa-Pro dipeptidyl-peptidase C-terminal domain-containing protein n=1 Tax=Caenispirillum salinarum AK4 TaxID=1238182 RepID=K9H6V3_9PROT|nr:CocE/NonD family hydrolase [Caenispirillum salinarum]EKV32789.1 hypothetical protein C882_1627 [Caenispirillum salinarum AK4]
MTVKDMHEMPHEVRCDDHVLIPMRDGINLSARIWRPTDSDGAPVPAILEYIPYRKHDFTATRDAINHPYFAGHGYAAVRVDIRGSGDSEGVLEDEYLESELQDGCEIIDWLAAQPWCDGNVGMIGISWGGFNGLQIAARRPKPLKAVVSVCSTDDRYTDDVHYMGGCLLGDNLSWASTMFAYNSLPPNPNTVGDKWREMWMERLKGSGLWLAKWLEHQHRNDFWKHGSINEDWSLVTTPVMAVSGWADGYTNAVFRLLQHLQGPKQGIVGPWSHKYPHKGEPGPPVGFLQECIRWWDHWLKGRDTGIMDEPMLRAWIQDSAPPTTSYEIRPGRWVGEPCWPSENIERRRLPLCSDRLLDAGSEGEVAPDDVRTLQSPLSVGLYAGKWCSYAAGPDLAHDQREEDGGALTFTTQPLEEDLMLLGAPWLELELTSSAPVAMVAARLSDVRPSNEATRVTWGILNLTHRETHEHPTPLEPGEKYRVFLKLNDCGATIPKGHRLRLSLSTSYWPLAWAPPEQAALRIYMKDSHLTLPIRTPQPEKDEQIRFGPVEHAPPMETTTLDVGESTWRVIRDLATDVSTLEVVKDDGRFRIESEGLEVWSDTREWYSSYNNEYDSLRGETLWTRGFRQGDWEVETVTRTVLTCDAENFYVRADLDAYEGETRVFCHSWNETIRRQLV